MWRSVLGSSDDEVRSDPSTHEKQRGSALRAVGFMLELEFRQFDIGIDSPVLRRRRKSLLKRLLNVAA